MIRTVAIGLQNFETVRNRNVFYVDKTEFISKWWEAGDDVTLITRPRRFGKTLNLSMVECFFSNRYAGKESLFHGLSIWDREEFRKLQGTYPVIFLSFARVKAADYEGMKYTIDKILSDLYGQNRFLLNGDLLSENEKQYFESIKPGMSVSAAADSVHSLAHFLSRYYGQKVIILLDEYDTPMQEAWLSGYWEEAAGFFRSFFNATFKTNPYLLRGLITGITRISKESVFSDLNNLEVVTTTSEKYASYFGFMENEVFAALDDAGLGAEKQGVKKWYDGFTFGSIKNIYNPWSIINFIEKRGVYDTYWADSSSNGLVNSLIRQGSADVKKKTELLLQDGSFEAELDEQVVFNQLEEDENAIWSLLLATGYLKVENLARKGILLKKFYTLRLTNLEIKSMFARMAEGWFQSARPEYNEFVNALLNDNVKKMNAFLNKVAFHTFSSFDSGNKPSHAAQPERFYHGFVIGLVVSLSDRYKIRSNRESGYGRYDVMMAPFDKREKAFLFEFKVMDRNEGEKGLEDAVANALAQIEEKQYEAELIGEGFLPENIRKYGVAFEGKQCLIG